MSREKKGAVKKHFLETESGFKRLLKANREEVPSEKTLTAIRDYSIRSGKLDPPKLAAGIPGTAAFYLNFILNAEQKSNSDAAKELGVSVQDLKSLQMNMDPIRDESLLEFSGKFVRKHPQFTLRQLFTLLKRAIVLHSMSSAKDSVRKAARKKQQRS